MIHVLRSAREVESHRLLRRDRDSVVDQRDARRGPRGALPLLPLSPRAHLAGQNDLPIVCGDADPSRIDLGAACERGFYLGLDVTGLDRGLRRLDAEAVGHAANACEVTNG